VGVAALFALFVDHAPSHHASDQRPNLGRFLQSTSALAISISIRFLILAGPCALRMGLFVGGHLPCVDHPSRIQPDFDHWFPGALLIGLAYTCLNVLVGQSLVSLVPGFPGLMGWSRGVTCF